MEPTIFKYILKYSRNQQIVLLVLTAVSFPFLYFSLDLPKIIVNEAIGGGEGMRELAGFQMDQVTFLLALCGIFLALVFVNGGFKYFLNVYSGVVGERMLRRLRYELFARVLRFPLPHFRGVSQGEIVSMVTGETEPIGGFVGSAISLPAFQGGTLLTLLVFMFVQDWVLGLAAVALYPLQMYVIPKLQRRVNLLKKERVVRVRKLSERIGEVVNSIQEMHAHDTSRYELAEYTARLGEIYQIRVRIYVLKFLIKFVNNFLAQVTPFFFFSIGGYLVIQGDLSFGALVAVLAAYKDLSSPWKELLDYYQQQSDVSIKYELLLDMFQPPSMMDEELQAAEPDEFGLLEGEVVAANLSLAEDSSEQAIAGNATFRFALQQKVALLGGPGSGKATLATMLAGLLRPVSGHLAIGELAYSSLPESVTGRQIGYVGQEPRLRSGTLRDNLYYALKHRPVAPADYDPPGQVRWEKEQLEARLSGNSEHDFNADWIDYQAAGVAGPDELTEKAIEALTLVDMHDDVYEWGLQGSVDPDQKPELVERILEARSELRDCLKAPENARLVELFDADSYNTNLSVAENLMFGSPKDSSFDIDNLAVNPYVRKLLEDTGLLDDFMSAGRTIAKLMVDLFADVAPESELFEQYSFISADDLPDFRSLLTRAESDGYESLSEEDRTRLLSLPFKIIPARHRLGVIDEDMQARLLEARKAFAAGFPADDPPVAFFDRDRFNPAVSIQDNILFGRLAYGRAHSAAKIGSLIREVVDKLALRRAITEIGLDYPVGIAAARLSAPQRQKLAIARCILKRPRLMIVDEATAVFDVATQDKIQRGLFESLRERGLIWVLHRASLAKEYDYAVVMEGGRVVEQGNVSDLGSPDSAFAQLAAAG